VEMREDVVVMLPLLFAAALQLAHAALGCVRVMNDRPSPSVGRRWVVSDTSIRFYCVSTLHVWSTHTGLRMSLCMWTQSVSLRKYMLCFVHAPTLQLVHLDISLLQQADLAIQGDSTQV
jgi:hypothetical protein